MLKRNDNIILRNVHDTCFLIDITQNYLDDICRLYEINEIGEFCWRAFDTCDNIEAVVNLLLENIVDEVEVKEVYDDVKEYINVLIDNGFVEEV